MSALLCDPLPAGYVDELQTPPPPAPCVSQVDILLLSPSCAGLSLIKVLGTDGF